MPAFLITTSSSRPLPKTVASSQRQGPPCSDVGLILALFQLLVDYRLSTFWGILRSEINGDICRLRVNLDVQKPLKRGVFVLSDNGVKSWVSFKCEKLPIYCFGCGRMGHSLNKCLMLSLVEKSKVSNDPPYSVALKAESKLAGKESIKLNGFANKVNNQASYIGLLAQRTTDTDMDTDFLVTQGDAIGGRKLASWLKDGSDGDRTKRLKVE
ncbi:hypothetical protein PVK06_037836 [Gossypium arboreum]|uniref:CCHC-type domain-containing protein n=1 Tax=Gossypium arboreum TaxID=29729 RepID=A0ABR0MYZ1_GOSAR|nr:hypothetical protein PVK06_037836 [Gossypium arboreum]